MICYNKNVFSHSAEIRDPENVIDLRFCNEMRFSLQKRKTHFIRCNPHVPLRNNPQVLVLEGDPIDRSKSR